MLGITKLEAANAAILARNKVNADQIPPLMLDPALQALNNARPETQKLFFDNPTPTTVMRGAAEIAGASVLTDPQYMRSAYKTNTAVTGEGYTIQGLNDEQGRPVVMSQPAIAAFAQMIEDSNGVVRASDITSSQRSQAHNTRVGGSPTSPHMTGNAVDIHGNSRLWMIENGAKYGWVLIDYKGSHGGHFEYRPN